MLNILYSLFIGGCMVFFLLSVHKARTTLILLQALLQYIWTLVAWSLQLNAAFAYLLLGFMIISVGLLEWSTRLSELPQSSLVTSFFTVSQWALIVILFILVTFRTPYTFPSESLFFSPLVRSHRLTLHPFIQLSGNLLIFTLHFHVLTHGEKPWPLRKSLLELGPIVIYFCTWLLLRFLRGEAGVYV